VISIVLWFAIPQSLEQAKLKKRQVLNKIKHDPSRLRKQVEQVEKIYSGLASENTKMLTETTSVETQLEEVHVNQRYHRFHHVRPD
jgi:hypothetical protein